MEYDSRMGIAYDALFYGVIYFNEKSFKNFFLTTYGIAEDEHKFAEELKRQIPEPPNTLYPFFFCDFTKPSFLVSWFYDDFYFGREDFTDFIERLMEDVPSLLQSLFQYYLSEDPANYSSGEEFVKKIFQLDIDRELQMQLIYLWSDYNLVFQQLNDFLMASYKEIILLYESQKVLIRNTLKIFTTEHFIEGLNILSTVQDAKFQKRDKIAVSLLNAALILQRRTTKREFAYVLGCRCNSCLDLHQNYYRIPIDTLFRVFGNKIVIDILLLLNEKEHTVTQLAEKIFVSRQTVNRHALWLIDFKLISVSRKTGPEVYYRINPKFFSAAKVKMDNFFMQFENTGEVDTDEKMEKPSYI